jgi:hypothetical protein
LTLSWFLAADVPQRVSRLVKQFRAELGPEADHPIMADAIRRTAETQALAEMLRARALRGDPNVSIDDTLRLTRTAEAMTRRLHLDRHRPAAPAQPSLSQYLGRNENSTGG